MRAPWLLKSSPRSVLFTIIMTLLISSCSTENSTATADGNTDTNSITNSTNTEEIITNQAARIGGTDTGKVVKDLDSNGDGLLGASGKLTISDSDYGEATFIAETVNSKYGSLTIDAAGNWLYGAVNSLASIQQLTSSDTLTDQLVIRSVDGTTHAIMITIYGANEILNSGSAPAPTIGTAMYSYNTDLSNAQPLSGAVLEQATVYMFFDNISGYSSVKFYCCKGIDGASTGETGNAPVSGSSTPFVYSVDTSQYGTTGTRELYVDATRADSSGYDSVSVKFSLNITSVPVAPAPGPTADVNLSWVAPSEREDNTAISLSDIAGYKIYYGSTQGNYNNSITINDGTATGYTFTGLPAGTYYFAITTRDVDGRESQYSTEVVIVI